MQSKQNQAFDNQRWTIIRPKPRRPIHRRHVQRNNLTASNQLCPKKPSVYGIKDGNTTEGRNWRETFYNLADRFGNRTNVGGFKYMLTRRSRRIQRILWMLAFLLALYLLVGMYLILTKRFRQQKFQAVVDETVFPIYKMPFPEVIICNENRLNWDRFDEAVNIFLKPEHHTTELKTFFAKIVNSYDQLTIYKLFLFDWMESEPLELLNYINFTNVVTFMSWRCEEILQDCTWRNENINCCDIFFPRKTNMGPCLGFNSILTSEGKEKQKSDPYWPWHTNKYGRNKGLNVQVMLRDSSLSPYANNFKGAMFMVMESNIYSDFHYFITKANHLGRISISGSYIYFDNYTRNVPSSERECVFDDEKESQDFKTLQGFNYNYENCLYECQQRYIYESCNCTLDIFFPPSSYPVCKIKDMPCIAKNWKNFTSYEAKGELEYLKASKFMQMRCNCLFSCYSLQYKAVLHTDPIYEYRILENESFVELDFSWQRHFMITYKTSMVFSWIDLLVSFGGIASLFLGVSLISVVEFLYFLLIEMPAFIWSKHRSDQRLKELNRKHSVRELLDYDSKH